MGHPGKLLSSQVVAIQWYLLQGYMLVFVKRYKQLYLSWNSERVCTSGAQCVNFRLESIHLWREICNVCKVSVFGLCCNDRSLSWWKHALSSQLGKVSVYYLTNIQLTPCTCMLVISSELLSALVIQRLNQRMSFMFISNHIHLHLNRSLFHCFLPNNCNLYIFKT